jgi:transposase
MRGEASRQHTMLSVVGPSQRVPKDHPIRGIKDLADSALKRLTPVFEEMYSSIGRPSIPPETLLKACLLIALYSIRSERQFCEQLDYNLLFRFFLDMGLEESSFDASTFAKNKERLLKANAAQLFFDEVVREARQRELLSPDHFTVDGTLIQAWASLKSFKPRDEDKREKGPPDDHSNPTVDWRGQRRSNETHQSTTDPEARIATKGGHQEAKMSFSAHALMENRNGLCVDLSVSTADGFAERREALKMIDRQHAKGVDPKTLGADKAYDVASFIGDLRNRRVTPHIAQQVTRHRGSKLDRRTTRHPGYEVSQRKRKLVEEIFGWMKTAGAWRKSRYCGVDRNGLWGFIVGAAYNLVRIHRLSAEAAS